MAEELVDLLHYYGQRYEDHVEWEEDWESDNDHNILIAKNSYESNWSSIPPDLMINVLARLPFPSLFQLKCVAKSWSTLLGCHSFLTAQTEFSCQWGSYFPVVYVTHFQGRKWRKYCAVYAYNPSLALWQKLPSFGFMPKSESLQFIAGAGGRFLCHDELKDVAGNLIVLNILTKSWRQLPPTTNFFEGTPGSRRRKFYTVTFLVDDPIRKMYHIILSGFGVVTHSDYRSTKVYDSKSELWKESGKLPHNLELKYRSGVFCAGLLYWWANEYDPTQRNCSWNILLAYDVANEIWTIVPQTLPQDITRERSLLGYGPRVLMVGKINGQGAPAYDTNHGIFELDPTIEKWVQIAKMPESLLSCDIGDVEGVADCGSFRNKICMISKVEKLAPIWDHQESGNWPGRWLVVYDRTQDKWQCIPCKCLTGAGTLRVSPMHGLFLEPNLNNI